MLRGKTIKLESPALLQFMYPGYQLVSTLNVKHYDQDIIYVGKLRPNLSDYLKMNSRSFINTVGKPDYDFQNRQELAGVS